MLRIYLMRQWFGLSDPLLEDSLYEVASMRHFAGLALNDDRIVDESTILQFRHLPARHHLTQGLFEAVERHLREQGYHLSKGTMVDETLIEASGSTKNQARERDREMRSRRKRGWSVSLPTRAVFGGAGYASDRYKRGARALGLGWYVNDKRKPGRGNLSASQKQRNRRNARVRARVARVFINPAIKPIACQAA